MGSFGSLMLQMFEAFIAQNASTIEAEVLAEIEKVAGSLFNTVKTVNAGGAPPVVKTAIAVPVIAPKT